MPIQIIRKTVKAAPVVPATVNPPEVKKAVLEPLKAVEAPLAGKVIPRCRYCGHEYLSGGCDFERQKTCGNHAPGKPNRQPATKSLD